MQVTGSSRLANPRRRISPFLGALRTAVPREYMAWQLSIQMGLGES